MPSLSVDAMYLSRDISPVRRLLALVLVSSLLEKYRRAEVTRRGDTSTLFFWTDAEQQIEAEPPPAHVIDLMARYIINDLDERDPASFEATRVTETSGIVWLEFTGGRVAVLYTIRPVGDGLTITFQPEGGSTHYQWAKEALELFFQKIIEPPRPWWRVWRRGE